MVVPTRSIYVIYISGTLSTYVEYLLLYNKPVLVHVYFRLNER